MPSPHSRFTARNTVVSVLTGHDDGARMDLDLVQEGHAANLRSSVVYLERPLSLFQITAFEDI